MRLDKLDGMGETVWAEDVCVEAAVTGFLEALKLKEGIGNYLGSAEEFLELLKSFSMDEMRTTFNPLTDLYSGTGDFPVVIANLDGHAEKLFTVLQNLPL